MRVEIFVEMLEMEIVQQMGGVAHGCFNTGWRTRSLTRECINTITIDNKDEWPFFTVSLTLSLACYHRMISMTYTPTWYHHAAMSFPDTRTIIMLPSGELCRHTRMLSSCGILIHDAMSFPYTPTCAIIMLSSGELYAQKHRHAIILWVRTKWLVGMRAL